MAERSSPAQASLRVISAGAGTGKTWRLAKELLDALTDPVAPVAPEGVVAVTFTRSAAAELEQRVRTALIDAGQLQLARRLAAARIGTVHAVCARLVEEHAFALGLSPELETVDDMVAGGLFEDALSASITDAQRTELDDLEQRFMTGDQAGLFFKWVRILVDRARANELDDDALARSCDESVSSLRAALPPPVPGADVEKALLEAVVQVLERSKDQGSDSYRKDLDVLRRARVTLEPGGALAWNQWAQLEESRFNGVAAVARRHLEHAAFADDLERMTRLVFDLARQTLQRYAADKRAAGVVDFTDQERLAVAAIEQPDVAAALAADVQLLLVDEFQDTSPLQLRLFNTLRRVASRTVLVGDEKQSIFGFRDARPEFFTLLSEEAGSTDRLATSWRSRPGLVRAVSAVFAEAFSGTHTRDEIVLDAALQQEPPGLGPIVERWTAEAPEGATERVKDEAIVSAGVAELLSSRDVPVRPRATSEGGVRPAQARDIAVLCRTNSECRKVARALHARGVPVVHARRGLSKTFEARLMSAALGLWLDDRDTLSRLALVQLLEAHRHDVAAVVAASEKGQAFVDHPAVVAVVEGAKALPWAGLVQAFDRVVDVLRIPEHLGGLPGPAQRLADLAALRALAVRFVEECVARGRGPTISGYLDRLEALRNTTRDDDDSDDDNRGVVAGEDAVTILTWHRAKGKEWPLVVLANLWMEPQVRPFEPVVETTVSLPDLKNPGFGQWLRFWPTPYAESRKSALLKALQQSPVLQRAEHHQREEERRLLYVAFTRARDRLIVVGEHTIWGRGMMRGLTTKDGRPLCADPPGQAGLARWAGVDVDAIVHRPFMKAKVPGRRAPLVLPERPATSARPTFPPMFLQPSAQEGHGVAGIPISLGQPVIVGATTRDELNPVGVCVHAFLAWDAFIDGEDPRRGAKAAAMVERFEVKDWMTAPQLITIADQLWRALDVQFPGHRRRTEVAMLHRLPAGTLMRGQLDLLLDLPDGGAVIVDHKTTWDEDVVGYAGQLAAYKSAVVAAGAHGDAVRTFIHLPLHARLVEVTTAP